ncbi:hypothetical protein NOR_07966 [Metarhizium rileyi]|uniref:Uncharacterized protein n=1 Tax=Metarhizium rileyi (strain RCEF 4871) TaxID=1649241 RepID=A0A166X3K8_METRR|nr:hypothetical protein NOR_07966 [Metarhizium rileyi RCEF 4871]
MVSSCLLPPSTSETARIYPEQIMDGSETSSHSTATSEHSVTQENHHRTPPVPDYWHHGSLQPSRQARDLRHNTSPLYTPNASHLAAPSDYFIEPDSSNTMSIVDGEAVNSPESFQIPVLSWLQNSQDWKHTPQIASDERTSGNSPTASSIAAQSTPATPYNGREYSSDQQNQFEPSLPCPSEFRLSLPEPPRLEPPPKRKMCSDDNDGGEVP